MCTYNVHTAVCCYIHNVKSRHCQENQPRETQTLKSKERHKKLCRTNKSKDNHLYRRKLFVGKLPEKRYNLHIMGWPRWIFNKQKQRIAANKNLNMLEFGANDPKTDTNTGYMIWVGQETSPVWSKCAARASLSKFTRLLCKTFESQKPKPATNHGWVLWKKCLWVW